MVHLLQKLHLPHFFLPPTPISLSSLHSPLPPLPLPQPPVTPIDPYMTVRAAQEEMQAVKVRDPQPSTDRHYSKVCGGV